MSPSAPPPPAAPPWRRLAGRAVRWSRGDIADVAGALVAVGIGLWITAGVWGSRAPAGDDVMALLVRADFGLSDLTAEGDVDGWSPRFITGYEHFLYYGPGFTWLVGLVRVLALGSLSLTGALKVVAVVGYLAVAPATAFLARSFGLSKRSAGAAAILALAVNNPFGLGLSGTFTIALLPHQVAATGFCIALGCGLRTVTDARRRWVVLLGAGLAAVLVTHVITTMVLVLFLAVALPTIFVTDRPRIAGAALRLGAAAALAIGLAAFWLVPYLAHFEHRGVVPAWATPPLGERVADILAGDLLYREPFAWLAVGGMVYGLWRAMTRARWAVAALVIPPVFLVVGHTLASRFPDLEISPQLANRGLGYAGLIAVLPLAAAIGDAAGLVRWRAAAAGVALITAAVAGVFIPGANRDVAGQMPEAADAMHEAARVLRRVVPDGARFATERDFPAEIGRARVSHPDFWLAWHARRDTLNIFGLELSPSPGAGAEAERIGQVPAEQSADALARLGVTHVVTVDPTTVEPFDRSGRFRKVWQREFMAVFEVVPAMGQPPPESLVSVPPGQAIAATASTTESERLAFSLSAPQPVTATVAVGWSPKWRASLDGDPVTVARSADGLLRVRVPAGDHRLVVRFEQDRWSTIGISLTVLTVVLLAVVVVVLPVLGRGGGRGATVPRARKGGRGRGRASGARQATAAMKARSSRSMSGPAG